MESAVWSEILKQSFGIVIMAIFCYVTYKYFTAMNNKLLQIIKDKDDKIIELYEKNFEMNKLIVETCSNITHDLKNVVSMITRLENKTLFEKAIK